MARDALRHPSIAPFATPLCLRPQGRGYHSCAWAAQAQGQEGQGVEEGIAPDIKYNPSGAPGVSQGWPG